MPLKSLLEGLIGGIIEAVVEAVGEVVLGIIRDVIPSKSSNSGPTKRPISIFKDEPVYEDDEVDLQAVILEKPTPDCPRIAKKQKRSEVVELSAILSSDGKVTNIRVVKSPSNSLARYAVRAARKIKFRPAMKNNVHVSQWVGLEYPFESN